jgi:hypothetical protein
MRIRLLLVTAAVTALSLVAASPASAAVSHSDVVSALLTADNLGKGWHKVDLNAGGGTGSAGCSSAHYRSTLVDAKAARSFKFKKTPTFITEKVGSFLTVRAAKRDFGKAKKLYSVCDSYTVDGETFTISHISLGDYADQEAGFKIRGHVQTAAGRIPVTVFVVTTRWGHQVISTTMVFISGISAADTKDLKKSTVRVSKAATRMVADELGR